MAASEDLPRAALEFDAVEPVVLVLFSREFHAVRVLVVRECACSCVWVTCARVHACVHVCVRV
jgi:hypothetical protein